MVFVDFLIVFCYNRKAFLKFLEWGEIFEVCDCFGLWIHEGSGGRAVDDL